MPESSSETLWGWGMANHARSRVYRPLSPEEVLESLHEAADRGLTIGHRGAGRSYGDAALNEGGAVVDMQGLNNIIQFDERTGLVRAESGVTVRQLWQQGIAVGWWPPIVPGTMDVTLGGALAMNIHGKNHFQTGTFGDHVRSLTLVMPDGSAEELTPETHPERFTATVGAQGLNGTILELTIQMKRVHSGFVDVEAKPARNLAHALEAMDSGARESAYSVGWLDCFAGGNALGRGALHFARHIAQDHPLAGAGMSPGDQALPERILGA